MHLLGDVRQTRSLDNARMSDGKRTGRVIPPPVYTMVCIALGALAERFFPFPTGLSGYDDLRAGAGALGLGAAGLLALWSIVVMTRQRTTVEPGRVPSKLVTSGPFRVSRNPIYLAFVMICASIGAIVDSAWLLLAALLLLVLLDRLIIVREEEVIAGVFGDEYAAYRSRVRRWL